MIIIFNRVRADYSAGTRPPGEAGYRPTMRVLGQPAGRLGSGRGTRPTGEAGYRPTMRVLDQPAGRPAFNTTWLLLLLPGTWYYCY